MGRAANRLTRAAGPLAALALAALGLVLLAGTQPWLVEQVPDAAGVVWERSRTGAEVAPLVPALALVAAASLLTLLAGPRWARWPGRVLGPVAATSATVLTVLARDPAVTVWWWVAVVAASVASVGSAAAGLPVLRRSPPSSAEPVGGGPPLPEDEQARWRNARTWAQLSEGEDPTAPHP